MKKSIVFVALGLLVVAILFNRGFFIPKVENMTFMDIENQRHSLLSESPTLVNMWASDCVACDEEMPKLKALHRAYSERGFRVLAVALSYDKLAAIREYTATKELNFPVIYDKDRRIELHFGKVRVTPTSFLIDAQGNVVMKVLGEPNWQKWEAEINKQLAS